MKRARVWIKVETFDDEGGPSREYSVPCHDVAEFDHYNHASVFAVELAARGRRLAVEFKGAVVHDDAAERMLNRMGRRENGGYPYRAHRGIIPQRGEISHAERLELLIRLERLLGLD